MEEAEREREKFLYAQLYRHPRMMEWKETAPARRSPILLPGLYGRSPR